MAPSPPSSHSSNSGISTTKQNANSSSFPLSSSSSLIASFLSIPIYSLALSQVSAWKITVFPSVAQVRFLSSWIASSEKNFAILHFTHSDSVNASQGIPLEPLDLIKDSYFFSTSDLPISFGRTSALIQGADWKTAKSDFFAQVVTSFISKLRTLSSGLSIPYLSIASFQLRTGNGEFCICFWG